MDDVKCVLNDPNIYFDTHFRETRLIGLEWSYKACFATFLLFCFHHYRMDIQMPIMDGIEAIRRLRQMGYTDLPIFALTASVSRSDFKDLGFDDWLPKPVTMKELKAKLYSLGKALSSSSYTVGKQ